MKIRSIEFKFSQIIFILLLVNSSSVFAWGERGHDIVTRVAVQNLVLIGQQNKALTQPFELRDHLLSHLSNTPDIVWRSESMTAAILASNPATHYINLEHVYDKVVSPDDLDLDFRAYASRVAAREIEHVNDVGTLPWRILQLYDGMVASFRVASKATDNDEMVAATNNALLYGGLMSHFVGDMANPHHTTVNHDGQLTGNTGLHAYFESDIVMALNFDLINQVSAKVGNRLLEKTILKSMSRSQQSSALSSPETLVFSLLIDSHNNLHRVTQLDNKYSLLKPSTDSDTKALRKPPEQVSKHYRRFVVERIAIAASVLSQLWLSAWVEGGEPNLSDFHSYHYPVAPDYIPPDYIAN